MRRRLAVDGRICRSRPSAAMAAKVEVAFGADEVVRTGTGDGRPAPARPGHSVSAAARMLRKPMKHGVFIGTLSASQALRLLDIRQPPGLVEERLLRAVKAEQHFEPAAGAGRHPVRLLPSGAVGPKYDLDRPVGIPLQARRVERAARPGHVPDQRVRRAVIDRRRPVELDRRVRRHVRGDRCRRRRRDCRSLSRIVMR